MSVERCNLSVQLLAPHSCAHEETVSATDFRWPLKRVGELVKAYDALGFDVTVDTVYVASTWHGIVTVGRVFEVRAWTRFDEEEAAQRFIDGGELHPDPTFGETIAVPREVAE